MKLCETCEGTGKCCGAPDCKGKCQDCYCEECTFAPCQCRAVELHKLAHLDASKPESEKSNG